jgi:hypothetical protein
MWLDLLEKARLAGGYFNKKCDRNKSEAAKCHIRGMVAKPGDEDGGCPSGDYRTECERTSTGVEVTPRVGGLEASSVLMRCQPF